jgi:hypothetical protein
MNVEPPIQPGQTAAVVVGVETYPRQEGWKIPGAAAEALAFASWLEHRGVSRVARHIACEGRRPGASYADVRNALFKTVTQWSKDETIRLLFVYWVGHGVIDRHDRDARLLLCDDASEGDAQAWPFEEYRAAMRDKAFPPYQVFLIDACAVPWLGKKINRGTEPPPRQKPDDGRRQFVLYSTSPGQVSSGVGLDGPSPFAAVLRAVLEECGTCWPPDMPRAAAEVQRRLKAAGATQRPLIETIGWDGDRDDPGATDPAPAPRVKVDPRSVEDLSEALAGLPYCADAESQAALLRGLSGGMAYGLKAGTAGFTQRLARNILAAPPELGELFEALARDGLGLTGMEAVRFFRQLDAVLWSSVSWRDVVRLIGVLTGHRLESVGRWAAEVAWAHPASATDDRFRLPALLRPALAAALLAQLPPPPSDPSLPLLTFAARLAETAPGEAKSALEAWVEEVSRSLGLGGPAAAPAAPAVARSTCFSVALFPLEGEDAGKFEVRAWRKDATQPQPKELTEADNRKTLAEAAQFVDDCAGRIPLPEVDVELFVPTAVLAEGLAPWEVNVTADSVLRIDEQYPVILRSWDRSFGRSRDFNQPARMAWQKRWGQCPKRGEKACAGHLADLYDTPHFDLRTMVREHRLKGPVTVAAALAAPRPGGAVDRAQAARVLHNLLVAGMPIAIWPEAGSAGGAALPDIRDKLRAFVLDEALDRLSVRVHRHQNGEDPLPDPAWRLCLFWDDPKRVPSLVDHQLTQPDGG